MAIDSHPPTLPRQDATFSDQGRSKRRGEAYVVWYVEPLSNVRMQPGAMFTIFIRGVLPPIPPLPGYVPISRSA